MIQRLRDALEIIAAERPDLLVESAQRLLDQARADDKARSAQQAAQAAAEAGRAMDLQHQKQQEAQRATDARLASEAAARADRENRLRNRVGRFDDLSAS